MTDDDQQVREEEKQEEQDAPEAGGDDSQASKAQEEAQEVEEAKEEMERIEEGDPPEKLEDWPGGKAKYQTYGGPEGESGYDEGTTQKLGPSSLRHHEGGDVSIEGEKVDDPSEFKGDPIPGGPSDPDAPPDPAMIGREKDDDGGGDEDGGDEGDESRSEDGDGDAEGRES
jgi:hypothetical protein